MPQIQANGIAINYQLEGPVRGPVVMLSHSLAIDLRMWDPQIGPLSAAGYRVLRYDTRGHGASDVPPGPYTMEQLAADAVGLMDALDLSSVHFCGLSMGGMVGQLLGARFANRIRSLILCSTSAHMPAAQMWDERIAAVREKGLPALVDATIDRWFTKTGQQRLPDAVEKIRNVYVNTSTDGFCACCAAIRDMDLRGIIPGIAAPTLILVGEHDEGTPVSHAEQIHQRISMSKLEVVADAAHLQNIEQQSVFDKTVLAFLSENGRG